jgi:hypothetical protein
MQGTAKNMHCIFFLHFEKRVSGTLNLLGHLPKSEEHQIHHLHFQQLVAIF